MLFLTSNGLSSERLMEKAQRVCAPFSKAAIVTTASVGYKEKDWHIPRLVRELESLRLSVDFFDFDTQKPESLLGYDIIEINGGNPFYLLRSMKSANCEVVLNEFARNRVVIGISAGSIVLQKNINLIAAYSPEMNDGVNLGDFTGFGLADIELLPHYSRFLTRFERFEERAKEYERMNNCEVIRLEDGQAVLVDERGSCLIGDCAV